MQLCMPTAFALTTACDELILLDEYITPHYEMAAYQANDIFYVITTQDNGDIELAFAEKGHSARSLWIKQQDIWPSNDLKTTTLTIKDFGFIKKVIDYGLQHQNESKFVDVKVVSQPPFNANLEATETDDYKSLMNQLEKIHGPEHSNYDWTGMSSNTVDGLTYNYKQRLDLDMTYRDRFSFNMGTSLGSLVATILGLYSGLAVPMMILGSVLGVAGTATAILDHAGVIASYYGSAMYSRYVLVEGGGPYYTCYKTIYYNGWIEEGNYNSATLDEIGTKYSDTEQVFESYIIQREKARESYES